MEVITLNKYCELSGDTPAAVRSRIDRGTWQRGIHVIKLKGVKQLYVDTKAIDEWARAKINHDL